MWDEPASDACLLKPYFFVNTSLLATPDCCLAALTARFLPAGSCLFINFGACFSCHARERLRR
jgi:hypothetical protein